MSHDHDDDGPATSASPPCFAHEVEPLYAGLAGAADPRQQADVGRWRKAERKRLISARLAIPGSVRREHRVAIVAYLAQAMGDVKGLVVSAYWPFRGEPDLRPMLGDVVVRGGRAALPVVVARGEPLEFRAWVEGDPLERGAWDIPVPAASAQVVIPDVVIAPLVGFDRHCFRLGYGGGFFDRTLAAMRTRPRFLGVGHSIAAIATIYPQSHDVPMDAVVTETGVVSRPDAPRG